MLPGMSRALKPRIVIVGAGNLGSALAWSLFRAGYPIEAILARPRGARRDASLKNVQRLAKKVGAHTLVKLTSDSKVQVVWFCVPDSEIKNAANALAKTINWSETIALHSSGALTSDELSSLRKQGAAVASAHPMMTFVPGSHPSLTGVPFAIEGDRSAVRVARQIVRDLGGEAFSIRKSDKAAYHAWGTFASPLFTALLATTERIGVLAGIDRKTAKRRMIPILRQTLENYVELPEAGAAFSGPIIRGDVLTVQKHLRVLRKNPAASEVYVALGHAALQYLPARNKNALKRLLDRAVESHS